MSDILDLIASCDVIEPLTLAAYQAASVGGWVRIEFLRDAGWSGYEVEQYLKKFRVPIHGRGFTLASEEYPAGTLFCYVKKKQARWAEYILRRKEIPVLTVFDERNEEWASQHDGPIPQWDERQRARRRSKRRRR